MCVYLDMNCIGSCLLQGGMRNAVLGHLTLLTTTATCLTTCRWGRGQRLEPTVSTREETSSASPIPLNRPSYKVWPFTSLLQWSDMNFILLMFIIYPFVCFVLWLYEYIMRGMHDSSAEYMNKRKLKNYITSCCMYQLCLKYHSLSGPLLFLRGVVGFTNKNIILIHPFFLDCCLVNYQLYCFWNVTFVSRNLCLFSS